MDRRDNHTGLMEGKYVHILSGDTGYDAFSEEHLQKELRRGLVERLAEVLSSGRSYTVTMGQVKKERIEHDEGEMLIVTQHLAVLLSEWWRAEVGEAVVELPGWTLSEERRVRVPIYTPGLNTGTATFEREHDYWRRVS